MGETSDVDTMLQVLCIVYMENGLSPQLGIKIVG